MTVIDPGRLTCAACRKHIGSDPLVINADGAVVHESCTNHDADLLTALRRVREAAVRARDAVERWEAKEAREDLDYALRLADAIDPLPAAELAEEPNCAPVAGLF